jgi:putative ABC transport system substrate-binding protein
MRRREFIAGLGSAAAWPLVARAQQAAMPVIGLLGTGAENDLGLKLGYSSFTKALADLGLDRWPQRADGPSLGWR